MTIGNARVVILLALLTSGPDEALTQVYKWVDENGVVNYGDKPPSRNKDARPIVPGTGSVSVVPGLPKEDLDRHRERDAQERLRQLEQEVDELRARQNARDNTPPEPEYTEVYVPVYGGYGWRPPHRPGAGRPGNRPAHPAHQPKSPFRPQPELPAFSRK